MSKKQIAPLGQQIAQQIMQMFQIDQETLIENDPQKISKVTRQNTAKLKKIVKQIGWPTYSQVGKEASNAVFFIIQHSDHQPNFQKEMLELMKSYPKEEVNPRNIAYLEDRVRKNNNQPQLYGTQIQSISNGEPIPYPIEDPDNVDQRRKAVGLEPLEIYKKRYLADVKQLTEKKK